jgi:rhodanese-related sulfurtransferase
VRLRLIPLVLALSVGCARPVYGSHVRFAPGADDDGAEAAATADATPEQVDVYALKAALDAGTAQLIDVRTPEEFAAGHVPGARNVPLDGLTLEAVDADPTRNLYVVCRSGRRSAEASARLRMWGASPRDVAGGTLAWIAAGFPVD